MRFNEHLHSMSPRADLRYQTIGGIHGLSSQQARMIEQNLINTYQIGNKGGQLFNKINSVSPRYWKEWGIIINF